IKSYEDLTNKFFSDCDAVKASTQAQDNVLLAEIRADQKALTANRTVSSMGDELKVSFGTYEGSKNGWNAYLSLYSDGVLLYTDSFIVGYEALSGKKAPDMATELDDSVIEEYTNNVDMYNSLLTRGDPILYFELDYTASAETDDQPSAYRFNFTNIRVINTVSGKTVQTTALNKTLPRTMTPAQDLREIVGIVASEKENLLLLKRYIENGVSITSAKKIVESDIEVLKLAGVSKMVLIPNKNFTMLNTEVTQKLYTAITGENPSYFKGENNPVERVSWFDAIYFCNKLSEKCGLTPVYAVDGNTDVTKWRYKPHNEEEIQGKITQNTNANGFRLPAVDEWLYAEKGEENYRYSGSDNLGEVGWYMDNSGRTTHPVAQKKCNAFGLYDMAGNVYEWTWTARYNRRYMCGSCYDGRFWDCNVGYFSDTDAEYSSSDKGFRIVRTVK
ncbi:MAG: SUMF1/EgtB/PvdO family nonheme iron enzyme, partial [Spirochaetaceae bacterium]|nr:SUMF1/EgtB/PvdO family nonheme iron enzyme [Spirochaetaceae bacterium]